MQTTTPQGAKGVTNVKGARQVQLVLPDQASASKVFRAERINDETKIVTKQDAKKLEVQSSLDAESEALVNRLLQERQAAEIAKQIQDSHPLPPLKQVFKTYGLGTPEKIEAVKTSSKSKLAKLIHRSKIGRKALIHLRKVASPEAQGLARTFRDEYIDAAAIAGSIFVSIVLISISNFI